MIPVSKWKWFGTPGHFICAKWCRFHLCTQVGDFLISTVGEYVHPRHSKGTEKDESAWLKANWPGEDIGYQRKYETMVFRCGEPCDMPGCNCGLPKLLNGQELTGRGANDRKTAADNHHELCREYSAKLPKEVAGE